MFTRFTSGSRRVLLTLAAPALITIGLLGAAPGWAQSNDAPAAKPGMQEHMHEMQAHRAEMMKHHLDAAAERLELKASQVPAWQTFAGAFTALHEPAQMGQMHEQFEKADAAGLVKMAADHAADRARKLSTLADATAKLQATMSDNQRALFTQMARHQMMRHHHHEHGGMHGHHDGDGSEHGGHGPHAEGDGPDAPPPVAMDDDDE
jgi:hypothetical protein